MAKRKLNDLYAGSRENHRKTRRVLKRAGKCIWRCGRKAKAKKGGGHFVLCATCLEKRRDRQRVARAKAKRALKKAA